MAKQGPITRFKILAKSRPGVALFYACGGFAMLALIAWIVIGQFNTKDKCCMKSLEKSTDKRLNNVLDALCNSDNLPVTASTDSTRRRLQPLLPRLLGDLLWPPKKKNELSLEDDDEECMAEQGRLRERLFHLCFLIFC